MEQKRSNQKYLGYYSMFAVLLFFVIVTFATGVDYGKFFSDLWLLISFQGDTIPSGAHDAVFAIAMNIIGLALIAIPVGIIAGIVSTFIAGTAVSDLNNVLDKSFAKGPSGVLFAILLEEVLARFIPLGVLYHFLPGKIFLYVFLLLGNGLWSLSHLMNFKRVKDRNPLRVLPQFLTGLIFSYVYLRYGFLFAFITHVLFDAILFTSSKKLRFNKVDIRLFVYYGILGLLVSFILSGRGLDLGSLAPWFSSDQEVARVQGLSFWDYAFLFLAVDCITALVTGFFVLDRTIVSKDNLNIFANILSSLLEILIIIGLNWLLSLFIHNPVTRAIVISFLLSILYRSVSGSGFTRVCVFNIPSVFITVVAVITLGYWEAVGLQLVSFVASLIPVLIRLNDEELIDEDKPIVKAKPLLSASSKNDK